MRTSDEVMSDEIKGKYEEALELTYQEFRRLDLELAAEVERAKNKLNELQEAKKAVALVYEGVSTRLGLKSGDRMRLDSNANSYNEQ